MKRFLIIFLFMVFCFSEAVFAKGSPTEELTDKEMDELGIPRAESRNLTWEEAEYYLKQQDENIDEIPDYQYFLTSDQVDKSYSHDCEITIILHLQQDEPQIGMSDINFELVPQDNKTTTCFFSIPWQDIEKDSNNNFQNIKEVKKNFLLPKGSYQLSYTITDPNAKYDFFCFQDNFKAKKGKTYRIEGLLGDPEWISSHKKDISTVYQRMGDTLWDTKTVDALTRYYERKDDKDISSAPLNNDTYIQDEYIRTWITLNDKQQKEFLKGKSGDVTKDFADYCKDNNIEILISIDKYDGLKNIDKTEIIEQEINDKGEKIVNEDTEKEEEFESVKAEKKKFPVFYLILIGLIGIVFGIIIYKKKIIYNNY